VLAIATRDIIPLAFLGKTAADHSETAKLAATLLVVGASFFVFDGVQTVANGALRGFNDTRIPLGIAVISFWLVGFPACYILGFTMGGGAVGVWIGLSISVAVYAALLVWRFRILIGRGYLPDLPGTPHH
jgi:MATE family multidrug resistance protein